MEAIIDEEGEGTLTYFCEIVYENITQELIYNGCVNCDFTDVDVDEAGILDGVHLDSAYQGMQLSTTSKW